jgi:DNA-directed RNA polymerase subunit RPC12/RpoP
MKTGLTCSCGQRIFVRDVMQQGRMARNYGPRYVYIRYRCSRCKRLGEQFIKLEEWDAGMLLDPTSEATDDEMQRFDEMGPITTEEVQRVRTRLTTLRRLPGPGDLEIPTEQT